MADPQLIEWIKAQQAQGFTPEQVTQYMYQMGYQQQIVEEAIAEASQPKRGGSKILIVTAGVILLIILIIAMVFIFGGEEEDPWETKEAIVTEAPKAGGLTPDELKSNILSSYIGIQDYAFTKDIQGDAITSVRIPDGRIEVKNRKAFSTPKFDGVSSPSMYIIEDKAYLKENNSWVKFKVKTDKYMELKNVINLIQDSDVILIEEDGSHIRIIPDNDDMDKYMKTFIEYAGVSGSDVECWLDSDMRVTKFKAEVTMEGSTFTINTDFSGYNSQEPIILPELAKDAIEIAPQDISGYGSEEGGGGTTDWKRSSTFIYGKGQGYNPVNPVTVAEEHADAINEADVNKFKKTTFYAGTSTNADLMQMITDKKDRLFIDDIEVFYCENDMGLEIDCENPGDESNIKVYIQGKKDGKTVKTTMTLEKDGGVWKETGGFIDQDHDQMYEDQGTAMDEFTNFSMDPEINETIEFNETIIEQNQTEINWTDIFNETEHGTTYTYEKGQAFDPMNPLTLIDAYVTAVRDLDVTTYKGLLSEDLAASTDPMPESTIERFLEKQRNISFRTDFYEVWYCLDLNLNEEDCENPVSDTIKSRLKIKEENGQPGTSEVRLTLEPDGWKIM